VSIGGGGTSLSKQWMSVFQVAAVYVGTVIGAGFATGKEIYEFFTRYGFYGLLGIIIAGYIFISLGRKMMVIALKHDLKNYMEFNAWLFGHRVAIFINAIFMLMLIGVTGVMMSGAGGLFEEQLGFSKMGGMVFTAFLAVVVMSWGIHGLLSINTFVVPAMVVFNLILMVISLFTMKGVGHLMNAPDLVSLKAFVSPFSYTAFNLALTQAVLVPLATEIGDEKLIKRGANLGGILLAIVLLSCHISLSSVSGIGDFNIPTAYVMKTIAPFLYGLYLFIIFGEIFTSLIGNAFGLERQLKKVTGLPSWSLYVCILGFCLLIGQVDYGPLISYLYPLFGYISLSFLVLLMFKRE
jgi:uncharacterized membrane protein YkvI